MIVTLLLLQAQAGPPKLKKLLPKPVHKVMIGMSMEEAKRLRPEAKAAETVAEHRITLLESPEPLVEVTWYFDSDLEGNPLYEVILEYPDEAARDAAATALFGEKNHEEGWRYDSVKGGEWPIAAWTFKSKLVVAAQMPGTEWEDGFDTDDEELLELLKSLPAE